MNRIEINDATDFELVAEDMLTDFCEGLHKDGFTRKPEDDDGFEDGEVSWVYTDRGQELAERYIKRITAVGNRWFPGDEIEVISSAFRYP